jgi:hypothetical protein
MDPLAPLSVLQISNRSLVSFMSLLLRIFEFEIRVFWMGVDG